MRYLLAHAGEEHGVVAPRATQEVQEISTFAQEQSVDSSMSTALYVGIGVGVIVAVVILLLIWRSFRQA